MVARTARRHGGVAHDAAARDTLRRDITSRGLWLEAFNAAGNPLHPVEGDRDDRVDDRVLRGALQLTEEFEVGTVVTMSGLPAARGDRFPAWITTVWPPENLRLLEHQWTVAVDHWGDVAAEARRRGVRIAVEMHANQLVYNVPALLRLRAAVGDSWRRSRTSAPTSVPGTTSPSVAATPTATRSGPGSSTPCTRPATTARSRSRTRTTPLASGSRSPSPSARWSEPSPRTRVRPVTDQVVRSGQPE